MLERTEDDEYLECKTIVDGKQIKIKHWNKNLKSLNECGKQYYYKHQHFNSYTVDHNKRGAMIGTWTRMQDNSNDDTLLLEAIQEKVMELHHLQYPKKYIAKTLKYMNKKTKREVWALAHIDCYKKWGRWKSRPTHVFDS